jgi:hypothetical protein
MTSELVRGPLPTEDATLFRAMPHPPKIDQGLSGRLRTDTFYDRPKFDALFAPFHCYVGDNSTLACTDYIKALFHDSLIWALGWRFGGGSHEIFRSFIAHCVFRLPAEPCLDKQLAVCEETRA